MKILKACHMMGLLEGPVVRRDPDPNGQLIPGRASPKLN